uniref:RCC1-like domain-containing protein n=1 Tax=Helicotheca tamesis TaxID=374047 RepID=A0A7S2MGG3_9STRA|mmetsp:Transcript_15761/g.21629  ORF Transcript_15761/g.21629 Transcript_15761/m.21629 type:complete len:476 (+) Transcript_15761:151-1578(+)|eukprot:CAMPEP_0185738482 /NCGR_PEP_ID=MMETSP1171-20130828/33107_1 /TAXON_ID=374046 /ORGANISM="Helicotheca tamensis, Strain CCMP826" /LENGTH=475 /DNA_ID=CAMNT_0028409743 /DNA_START=63 /DNA_END=1490 /DNA_ORIENTATION=-
MSAAAVITMRIQKLRDCAFLAPCTTSFNFATSSSPPSLLRRRRHNAIYQSQQKQRHYSAYAWGTSKKGIIPLPEIIDEGQKAASQGTRAGSDFLARGTVIDYPRLIDVEKAFGSGTDGSPVTIAQIECGPTGTATILSDGRCFTYGSNKNGELGHGNKKDVLVPTELSVPESCPLSQSGVSTIKLGNNFSAIIDTNGDLYTFGFGGSTFSGGIGYLGHGDGESYTSPKLVESLVEDGCYADQVTVGESHMAVLTTEGEVLTCGAGSYGRLGNLETTDQLYLEPVDMLTSEDIMQISGGSAFTLALSKDGTIHGWGQNNKGQLGVGLGLGVDIYAMEALPRPIEAQLEGRRVVKVAAGHSHAAAVTDRGELFIWGSSVHWEPELMSNLLHTKIVDVVCGQNYTIALAKDGKMYSFGNGKTGVLGQASKSNFPNPTLVEGLADEVVVSMSAGWSHVACLVEDKEEDSTEETAPSEEK